MVVGRAGIGLDNVDVEAATAPRRDGGQRAAVATSSRPPSTRWRCCWPRPATCPRPTPRSSPGRWERSRWEGVELADKTLGIVGLGRIGKLVAERAKAFGMRLVAYDPFVSADRARQMGVELLGARPGRRRVRLPHDPPAEDARRPIGLIGRDLLLKAKPTLRVINVARGGIVDEAALADAIRDGVIAGAALDVFATEPTTESPLFELDAVVVTPHLGASAPARRRTRPATRSPTWCSWRSPASSCRSP